MRSCRVVPSLWFLNRCAATNDTSTGPRWRDGAALLAESQNEHSIPKLSFEPPNPSIHTFSGALEVPLTKARAACGASELCLRGAVRVRRKGKKLSFPSEEV